MGFNATRRYRDEKGRDVALLIAAIIIIGALLLWGFGII